MKTFNNTYTASTLFFLSILLGWSIPVSEMAQAKSTVWNTVVNHGLAYRYGHRHGFNEWSLGILNPNVSVSYSATVKNSAGVEISESTVVPVGEILNFSASPHKRTDIAWFGTGYTVDSPYGQWISGAGFPGSTSFCSSENYVTTTGIPIATIFGLTFFGRIDVYGGLTVHPPSITITHTGSTAGLACNATGSQCTVTSPGIIRTQVSFGNTQGRFYYGYYQHEDGWRPGDCTAANLCKVCVVHSTPMRIIDTYMYSYDEVLFDLVKGTFTSVPRTIELSGTNVASSEYVLPVSARTISFAHTAVSTNNPPSIPTLTGPVNGYTNVLYPFTAQTTDPDGDTVRYGFDWNNDSVVDVWTPYGSSGFSSPRSYQWATAGVKSLKVIAQDSKGTNSGWSTVHQITIAVPKCLNSTPLNATIYPGDDLGLSGDVGKTYSPTNTPTKCEYSCDMYYSWNGSSCALAELKVEITPSDSTYQVGSLIRWTAKATGGIPPYFFSWSGVASGPGTDIPGNKSYIEKNLNTIANGQNISVEVVDGNFSNDDDTKTFDVVDNRNPQ
jgi:hypothetical protein